MQLQTMKRGTFRLAGIRWEVEWPGWDGKAEWLGKAFEQLDERVAALPGVRSNYKYFIYHFVPWESFMVCVEVEQGTALPAGFVEVQVPDVRYDIYTHTGSMSTEQQTFDLICVIDDSVEPDEEKIHFEHSIFRLTTAVSTFAFPSSQPWRRRSADLLTH
jgi:predicted transcriptional regulator YdeE